jgi:hypothetical protein
VIAVTDRDAHVANTAGNRLVADNGLLPYRRNKFFLRDQSARVFDQMSQDFEALRAQLDLPLRRIEETSAPEV